MRDKLIQYFMTNIRDNNKNLDNIKLDEIKYGLLGLYSIITKTIVIVILAIILDIFKEFILFLMFYSILRSVGYGTHAKSNIMCWVTSTLLLIGLPYVFMLITINLSTKIIIWSICFIIYIIFCPADTEKRPMINRKLKLKFKILIILISLIYLVLIINYNLISNYIVASMILQAFLSSPLGYILMGQKVRFRINDIFYLSK